MRVCRRSALRRNKFLQTEAVRSAGLTACSQVLANCAEDVEAFLQAQPASERFCAVVKPVEGAGKSHASTPIRPASLTLLSCCAIAGSDGVSVCASPDDVRRAYTALEGTKNVLGLDNYSVLLQEYLDGVRATHRPCHRSCHGAHAWRAHPRRITLLSKLCLDAPKS